MKNLVLKQVIKACFCEAAEAVAAKAVAAEAVAAVDDAFFYAAMPLKLSLATINHKEDNEELDGISSDQFQIRAQRQRM